MKKEYQASPLLLIDGNNLLYRAAYGFPAKITNRKSENITTVFAFFALLRIAFREIGYPLSPVICFDGEHALDSRRAILSSYKRNRINSRNPYGDLPLVMESLFKLGLPVVVRDFYEADDVIAQMVINHKSSRPVYILSSDKDFYQLLDKNVSILNTTRKAGERLINSEHILEKFGVPCDKWVYYRALMGDQADFISGISGVGPKTALKLLALEEEELKEVLARQYKTTWDTYIEFVTIISLQKALDFDFDIAEIFLEDFDTPAKVIEKLGLWG